MSQQAYADATLVLLGHGTTLNADAQAAVYQHAAALRRRGLSDVREAFWKQAPRVQEVLASVRTPRVFVVPLFMSAGYFSDVIIPRQLGFEPGEAGEGVRVRQQGGQIFCYCRPVGTHERMAGVVLSRARGVVEQFPFPRLPGAKETTLFVAGHGTPQNENSRQAIQRQVERVKAQSAYADVHAIFLEEEPRIGACYGLARTRHLVVVPFFLGDGLHVQEDIPRLLGEPEAVVKERQAGGQPAWRNPTERHGKLVWYSGSVGTAPEVADIILERVREAGGDGSGCRTH